MRRYPLKLVRKMQKLYKERSGKRLSLAEAEETCDNLTDFLENYLQFKRDLSKKS